MRLLSFAVVAVAVGLAAVGCEQRATFDGPKVDKFVGKLVHGGKPAAFPVTEKVQLKLIHEKGQSFNVPIGQDGTFNIGWMPTGKYSAILIREKGAKKGTASQYGVPGGLTIQDGQTEYQIDLGKGFKL